MQTKDRNCVKLLEVGTYSDQKFGLKFVCLAVETHKKRTFYPTIAMNARKNASEA